MSLNIEITDGWFLTGYHKTENSSTINLFFTKAKKTISTKLDLKLGVFLNTVPFVLTAMQKIALLAATDSLDEVRPWGQYRTTSVLPKCIAKTITINPNCRFSLQYHNHRKEIWTVVAGSGFLELGERKVRMDMVPGSNVVIDIKQIHRMTASSYGITFNEIQLGDILEESDIVRLDDDYNRI